MHLLTFFSIHPIGTATQILIRSTIDISFRFLFIIFLPEHSGYFSSGSYSQISDTVLSSSRQSIPYPINHPQHPAGKYPIQNHGASNCKYLASNSKDVTLLFVFDCRRGYGIGKTGNRNKNACAGKFCNARIKIEACEKNRA